MRTIYPCTRIFLMLALAVMLLSSAACIRETPLPAPLPTAPAPTYYGTTPEVVTATSPAVPTGAPSQAATFNCGYNPITAQIVDQIEAEAWLGWIRRLSGADPVVIGGEVTRITTRWTPAMFGPDGESPQPHARAFEYMLETLRGWYPEEQIEVQSFTGDTRQGQRLSGKNLILTLPGQSNPDEVVILSAHLDSTTIEDPMNTAPGAEDNGSGSAALLEAARLFKDYRFERTIRIIWFTAEEEGLLGSRSYVAGLADPEMITGVINLDMFGVDADSDRCFELHVGSLPASDRVGSCFIDSAEAYQQGLEVYDYLTSDAVSASDHSSFWNVGVGAIEVLENLFDQNLPGGCPNEDHKTAFHTAEDTVDKIFPDSGIRIVRAALAAVTAMAEPLP